MHCLGQRRSWQKPSEVMMPSTKRGVFLSPLHLSVAPFHNQTYAMAPEMRHQLAGWARPLVEAIRVPSGRHSAMMYPGTGGVRS